MQSLDSFVHISEPVKDAAGVAWCTGSGYAILRLALDGIAGFPTGSLAEDVCCSSVLLGAGWKTAYVHEPLQYGTVPESFSGHIKQRTRWVSETCTPMHVVATNHPHVDYRDGTNLAQAEFLPLWLACEAHVTISTVVRIRVQDLFALHNLLDRIVAYNAHRLDGWWNLDCLCYR